MTHSFLLFLTFHMLTLVYTYDPATCIQCRSSHVCNPPDCFCCRDEMPLGSHNIPQMVFFTFDDAVTPQVAGHYRDLFDSKRKNPNGCPISMTLFISHSNTVYRLVREFYDKGMEIASHSVTHSHPNPKTFLREARKQRLNLAEKAKIPEKDIVGWRSPFLEPLGDTQPSVLKQLGYEYDATLTVSKKGNKDKAVTPFTLDFGWPYDCKIKPCPNEPHKGFWEVPVVSVKDYLNKYDCVYVDGCNNPPPSENLAYKFLWDNFQTYYKTNRAPMGINMHASWFYYPDRKAAMDRFIKKLGTMNDVYLLSVKQVLAWLKHPTPLQKIKDFDPWRCDRKNSSISTPAGNNIVLNRTRTNQNVDKLYQKMAEQRNQWRREHLQRERHRNNFQSRPIIPPAQPHFPPDIRGGPGPVGPPVPAIPPLVPNHPMINFWWQPPPGVLPPHVQHEIAIRRDMEMRQLEEQRQQEAMERQRMELQRQRRLEAQRRAQEQRIQALKRKQQEEQRRRQELLKQQEEQRKRQELLKQKEEQRKKQELLKKQKEQRRLKQQMELKQRAIRLQQQKEQIKKDRALTDPGVLVEYLPVGDVKGNEIKISNIEKAIHRPPMREVHQQQLIKEKLKLHPGKVTAEHIRNGKDSQTPAMQTSTTSHDHSHGGSGHHVSEHSNVKTTSHSQLLNNILNYKPSERIKYLHMLSLDELKSLQAELRRRLASDGTTVNSPTEPVANVPLKPVNKPDIPMISDIPKDKRPSVKMGPTSPLNDPYQQELTGTVTNPSINQPSKVGTQSEAMPDFLGSDLFAVEKVSVTEPTVTTSTTPVPTTTPTTPPTTTTTTTMAPTTTTTAWIPQIVTELTTVYQEITSKITELTTVPTVQTSPETTTTVVTTTTTTALPITQPVVSTEQPFYETTSNAEPIGGKSLWQISDIFDMSNHINGGKPSAPTAASHSQSHRVATILPSKPKSLFSIGEQYNFNDVLTGKMTQQNPTPNVNEANVPVNNQKPTAFSKLASTPARFSKSLFKVGGFDNSNSIVYTGTGNGRNRGSLPVSNPLPTARLTIGPRDGYVPSAYTTTTAPTTTLPTTTEATTTPTPSIMSLRQRFGFRQMQKLIQPVNLFDPAFGAVPKRNTNTPASDVIIPKLVSIESTTNSNTDGPITYPVMTEPEYVIPGSGRTVGSTCSQDVNCYYPDCVCKSDTTPYSLPAKQLPQIVYITIDGSLNFHTYSKIGQLFSKNRVNPNGCPIKGTLFVTDAGSNYRIADILHKKGLEIGLSGLSSRPQKSGPEVENNIVTLTEQITKSTSVSPMDIKGWRSPGFVPVGDVQYQLLGNYSLYDSSLVAKRKAGAAKLWPFTLDFGWNEDCGQRPCPTEDHPGVMEVPILPFMGPGNSSACEYTDACTQQPASEQETLDYLLKNFNSYYKTNRAPFTIRLKQIWFHWYYRSNLRGLIRFLDTILGYKDVYVTSVSDMLDWVKDPTPLNQLNTFQPWKC